MRNVFFGALMGATLFVACAKNDPVPAPAPKDVVTIEAANTVCGNEEQTFQIPVTVSKTLLGTDLAATTDVAWLTPGEYADREFSFQVTGKNPSLSNRLAKVTFTYGEASKDIWVIQGQYIANCYVVSAPGSYCLKAVKGGAAIAPISGVASAEVLWESFGTDAIPKKGDVVASVSCGDGLISFSTPETLHNGNAVIAAKDASGKVLWSWHIWICEGYNPNGTGQDYYNAAGTMMDRNLGALSTEAGTVEALGLLYQWGRKDPFLGSSRIAYETLERRVKAASTLVWPDAVASDATSGTLEYAVANPTTFIKMNANNDDWYYSGDASTDNARWGEERIFFDPCPAGWRVPAVSVWVNAWNQSKAWDDTKKGGDFTQKFGDAPSIWYPAAGNLDDDAFLALVGVFGFWWSCTPGPDNGYQAYSLYVREAETKPKSLGGRGYAHSVRCVKSLN